MPQPLSPWLSSLPSSKRQLVGGATAILQQPRRAQDGAPGANGHHPLRAFHQGAWAGNEFGVYGAGVQWSDATHAWEAMVIRFVA